MRHLLLALSLFQPLLSFAQLLPIPILTTTLYAVMTPSISTPSDSITFTLTSQQNSSDFNAAYPIITPLSSTTETLRNFSSGDILLAPPATVTETKSGSGNNTVVGTAPRNTNIRYVTSSTTTILTNSTTSTNVLPTSTPTGSTDISKTSATSTKTTDDGIDTATAATGGARGRGDNHKATSLMLWMAVALGGVCAGMMSLG